MHAMSQDAADLLAAMVAILVACAGVGVGVGVIAGLVREALSNGD